MADDELIAETNQLLKRVLELDAEHRLETEKRIKELDDQRKEIKRRRQDEIAARLIEDGFSEADAHLSDEEWKERRWEAEKSAREQLIEAREREAKFRDELLSEMRAQTEVLRQIAERLEK